MAIANTLACPLVADISHALIVHYRISAEYIVSLISLRGCRGGGHGICFQGDAGRFELAHGRFGGNTEEVSRYAGEV